MSFGSSEIRQELGSPSSDVIEKATLDYVIENENDFYPSAARAARIVERHFSLKADRDLSDVSYEYQDRADKWAEIARSLEAKCAAYAKPFMGGISESDKETRESDEDRPEPFFTRDMLGGY